MQDMALDSSQLKIVRGETLASLAASATCNRQSFGVFVVIMRIAGLSAFQKMQAACNKTSQTGVFLCSLFHLRAENQRAATVFTAFHVLAVCGTWAR